VRARAFTTGWMRGGEAPPATTRGPHTGNPQAERRALVPRGRGDRHRRGTLQMQARRCRRGATQAPPLPPRREGGARRAHHCANKNVPQQRKKRSEERDTAPQRRRAAATTSPHSPQRRRRRRRVHAKKKCGCLKAFTWRRLQPPPRPGATARRVFGRNPARQARRSHLKSVWPKCRHLRFSWETIVPLVTPSSSLGLASPHWWTRVLPWSLLEHEMFSNRLDMAVGTQSADA